MLIEVAARGPHIRFDPGSRVTISAKSRSGPALSQLAPNAPPASAAPPAVASAGTAPTPAAAPPAGAAATAPATTPAGSGSAQPDPAILKSDFIPGEKTLFYDDFSDMLPDEAPPHFKVRGVPVQLKQGPGFRQATVSGENQMTPNLTGIPKNFTAELEMFVSSKQWSGSFEWRFFPKGVEGYAGDAALIISCRPWDSGASLSMVVDAGRPAAKDSPTRLTKWTSANR